MTFDSTGDPEYRPKLSRQKREDHKLIERIEKAVLLRTGGADRLRRTISLIIREAMSEVIDPFRTGRSTPDEIERSERAFLRTKVEVLLRHRLGFPRGNTLDLQIDGIETKIKNTMRSTWLMPPKAKGSPCILIKTDTRHCRFSVGIGVPRSTVVNSGGINAERRTALKQGINTIHWICRDSEIQESSDRQNWEALSPIERRGVAKRLPDPDEMNEKRAMWAQEVMTFFEQFGETRHQDSTAAKLRVTAGQNLSDLLADLAHYCDRAGLSFKDAFLAASSNYEEETEGEGGQLVV